MLETTMKNFTFFLFAILVAATLAPPSGMAAPRSGAPAQAVKPIGMVTAIQPGQLTLHTDAGPQLTVKIPGGVFVLKVPPGAKSLAGATRITVSDISVGDRVLILGPVSADKKSVLADRIIVMSKSALAEAHKKEQLDWQQHGIGGIVKSLDPASRKIVIAVPNFPPKPGNPTHLETISLKPHAQLLRYAPDSIRFSDAKPSTFGAIRVGDQVRALGGKSPNGNEFTAEKLVSGTFHNIGATVISVNAPQDTITVKDLATGKPLLVRVDADSQLHQLPQRLAEEIARFNAGAKAARETSGPPASAANGRREHRAREHSEGFGKQQGEASGSFQQMLAKTPVLTLNELKTGEPLIVVSTAGAKPAEVTAIAVLSGVEPILRARPKGSRNVELGPWNMSMGGGGGEETGP